MKKLLLINKIFYISLFLFSLAYGDENNNTKNVPIDDFMLNMRPLDAAINNSRIDRFLQIKNQTIFYNYFNKPITLSLKDVNTIYIHPSYLFTIKLPENFVMEKEPIMSFEPIKKAISNNFITLQVPKNFINGNMIIAASNEEKNFLITLNIRKIDFSDLVIDSQLSSLAYKGNHVSSIINFKKFNTFSIDYILDEFIKLHNLLNKGDLSDIFQKHGAYKTITLNNTHTYYIIRDDINYELEYRHVRFRVSENYDYTEIRK